MFIFFWQLVLCSQGSNREISGNLKSLKTGYPGLYPYSPDFPSKAAPDLGKSGTGISYSYDHAALL